tara:strand:- start:116353 stop:116709 length:357 start_codon:yes stop_codon:yes gene_type:complete
MGFFERKSYLIAILDVLKKIWLGSDLSCSLKLKIIIPKQLPCYEEKHEIIKADVSRKYYIIDHYTVEGLLKPIRGNQNLKFKTQQNLALLKLRATNLLRILISQNRMKPILLHTIEIV